MTKEEILEYVLNTPENTNRAVLSDMLDQLNSNNGSNNNLMITITDGDYGATGIDKTYDEIKTAIENGNIILINNQTSLDPGIYPIISYKDKTSTNNGTEYNIIILHFIKIHDEGDYKLNSYQLKVYKQGQVYFRQTSFILESDNLET